MIALFLLPVIQDVYLLLILNAIRNHNGILICCYLFPTVNTLNRQAVCYSPGAIAACGVASQPF